MRCTWMPALRRRPCQARRAVLRKFALTKRRAARQRAESSGLECRGAKPLEIETTAAPSVDEAEEEVTPIAMLLRRLTPTAKFTRAAQTALAAVAQACARAFGEEAWVLPFGSLVQGTNLRGSDLDLCIHAPGLAESRSDHIEHTMQVMALKRLLWELPPCFAVQETRFYRTVRVPIVILNFTDDDGQLVEVDVSMGVSVGGVEKGYSDRLVRRVVARAPQVLPLVQIVKHWAKVERLNKAFDGFLNPLGWTLLVIYWFMERGDFGPEILQTPEIFEVRFRGSCTLPPPLERAKEQVAVRAPSTEDLASFFSFVASFGELGCDDEGSCISIVDHSFTSGGASDPGLLFIEDPGVRLAARRSVNIARCVRHGPWQKLLKRAGSAANVLQRGGAAANTLLGRLQSEAEHAVAKANSPAPTSCSKQAHGRTCAATSVNGQTRVDAGVKRKAQPAPSSPPQVVQQLSSLRSQPGRRLRRRSTTWSDSDDGAPSISTRTWSSESLSSLVAPPGDQSDDGSTAASSLGDVAQEPRRKRRTTTSAWSWKR